MSVSSFVRLLADGFLGADTCPFFRKSIRGTSVRRALYPDGRLYGARKSFFFCRCIWMKFCTSGKKLTNELWLFVGIVVKHTCRKKNVLFGPKSQNATAYSLGLFNLIILSRYIPFASISPSTPWVVISLKRSVHWIGYECACSINVKKLYEYNRYPLSALPCFIYPPICISRKNISRWCNYGNHTRTHTSVHPHTHIHTRELHR